MFWSDVCGRAAAVPILAIVLAACGAAGRERAGAAAECHGVPPGRIAVEGVAFDSASRCALVYAALKALKEAPGGVDVEPHGDVESARITLVTQTDSTGSVLQKFYLIDIPLPDRPYDAEVQFDYSTADAIPRRTLKPPAR
jgi:hypothetical protein